VELARVLAARGCDLLSLAAGRDAAADLAAIALSDRIRHEAGIPTLVGGGVDTRPDADSVLAARTRRSLPDPAEPRPLTGIRDAAATLGLTRGGHHGSDGGDVLIETLLDWDVEVVFGLPGDGINGIMEALRTRQDRIRFVQVRHEESAPPKITLEQAAKFAQAQKLGAAHFTAIGAFSDVTLGYFDRAKRDYKKIPLHEQVEVLSLIGDVALDKASRRSTRTSSSGAPTARRAAAICWRRTCGRRWRCAGRIPASPAKAPRPRDRPGADRSDRVAAVDRDQYRRPIQRYIDSRSATSIPAENRRGR